MNFETLKKRYEELQELTVWMTGCGYDFSQHSNFREKQHLLSLKVSEDNDPVANEISKGHIKISDMLNYHDR